MESGGISQEDLKEAKAGLPSIEFVQIDEEFLDKYKTEIGIIKQYYEPIGGIHLLESGEYSIIARVPNNQILKKVTKSKNLEGYESDFLLVGECLIYPSAQTISEWIKKGATGIASVFSKKLLEQAHVLQEATAKKL